MYFNTRVRTLQLFTKSISKLTQSTVFSLIVLFAIGSFNGFGQTSIFSNPITGTNPSTSNPYTTGQVVSAGITVSGIGRGSGVDARNLNNSYYTDSWTDNSSISTSDYIEWVINVDQCKKLDLNSLILEIYKNDKGPRNICLRSSSDNFQSNIPLATTSLNTLVTGISGGVAVVTGDAATYNLTANLSSLLNITSTITFRLYGYNGEDNTSSDRRMGVNSFDFTGIISNLLTVDAGADKSLCFGHTLSLAGAVSGSSTLNLVQDFDVNSTFGYSVSNTAGTVAVTSSNSAGNIGNGHSVNNGNAVVSSSNITNLSNFVSKQIEFKLSSISINASNGADNTDSVLVSISLNGGVSYSKECLILGNSNARWSYAAGTGIAAVTYDGNNVPTIFQPSAGGNRTTDGFSTVKISIPNSASQVLVRIQSRNNDNNEIWAIDDMKITGTAVNTNQWSSNPSGFISNSLNVSTIPSQTTTYTLTYTSGACVATDGIAITLPTPINGLSLNGNSATCQVSSNGWVHFYHSSGRLIGSINSQGQNLGNVTMTSYVDVTNGSVPSCEDLNNVALMTSVLQRHWVVTPEFQPTTPVLVRWPQLNNEFNNLSSVSTGNANINDDIQVPQELKLSKYDGANVNANPLDNCGTGTTTLYSQVNGGGDINSYASIFTTGNGRYTEFSISGFSEFWLHGSSTNSPLPVELTSFNAVCEEGKGVNVTWSTASEHNSSYFDVLKSEDGHNWRSISIVSAAGNSTSNINYGVVDAEKANGIAYYKLMQYDIDGQSKEYGPISSDCYHLGEMVVKTFPNPGGDEFYVELISPEATSTVITIIDAQGKSVYTRTVETEKGSNLYTIESLNVLPGMYYIQISNDLTTPNVVKHSFR